MPDESGAKKSTGSGIVKLVDPVAPRDAGTFRRVLAPVRSVGVVSAAGVAGVEGVRELVAVASTHAAEIAAAAPLAGTAGGGAVVAGVAAYFVNNRPRNRRLGVRARVLGVASAVVAGVTAGVLGMHGATPEVFEFAGAALAGAGFSMPVGQWAHRRLSPGCTEGIVNEGGSGLE